MERLPSQPDITIGLPEYETRATGLRVALNGLVERPAEPLHVPESPWSGAIASATVAETFADEPLTDADMYNSDKV